MEKYLIRREFIKLKIKNKSNKECGKIIREKYSVNFVST